MKKISDIEVAKKMINLQQSATSRGYEYDLSFETVKTLMSRTHCFYTGVKFEDDGKNSMSIDRMDSKKGYVEGNVVACTVDINAKKANLTFEEIESIYKKLIIHIKPSDPSKNSSIRKNKKKSHEKVATD